jgi:NAD(P)-dependent dehydrogenase (short-subunit alcohol dehydrogenase family)
MREKQYGRVVNIASIAGKEGEEGRGDRIYEVA